jgi:holo-[acyl-carrier protein] synthase
VNERQFYLAGADDAVIVGFGIDIAEIDRVEAAIRRHGKAFLERVFTPAEISYCERHKKKFERYAARFAAKEAAMKALGTGWRKGVRWRDIEVKNQPGGKPMISFAGAAGEHAARLGATHNSLSITHSGNLAFAQVILES